MLKWPLEGLLFDVENNDLWWPAWGPHPSTPEARADVMANVMNGAPKLIPIFSHRFIPAEPNEAGNPIFSVYQSDVIYYGADLADYFDREFGHSTAPLPQSIKHIPFWSELAEHNS